MRILCFIPYGRLEPEVVKAVLAQEGVEYFDIWFAHDNPHSDEVNGVYKNMQLAYEKMRQIVLRDGYEAVWIVEADTVPPKDALRKLLDLNVPVASGLYALRHGVPAANIRNGGGAWPWSLIKQHWGKVVEITGGCFGCVLIRRSALQDFSMLIPDYPRAPDMPFMNYCEAKGIKQMADISVVCGHIRPNGEVIYPDREKGYVIKRLAI